MYVTYCVSVSEKSSQNGTMRRYCFVATVLNSNGICSGFNFLYLKREMNFLFDLRSNGRSRNVKRKREREEKRERGEEKKKNMYE